MTQGQIERTYDLHDRAAAIKTVCSAIRYIADVPAAMVNRLNSIELLWDGLKNALDHRATGREFRSQRHSWRAKADPQNYPQVSEADRRCQECGAISPEHFTRCESHRQRSVEEQIAALTAERDRLRLAVLNQCGDNLCHLTDEEATEAGASGRIPPWPEFQESCRRFHALVSRQSGELTGCMTIAMLEAEVQRLTAELEAGRREFAEYEQRAEAKYAETWAERNGWQARAEIAERERDQIREALASVEWEHDRDDTAMCVCRCGGSRRYGHDLDCLVGRAMAMGGKR